MNIDTKIESSDRLALDFLVPVLGDTNKTKLFIYPLLIVNEINIYITSKDNLNEHYLISWCS